MTIFEALQQDNDSHPAGQRASYAHLLNLRFFISFAAFIAIVTSLSYSIVFIQSPSQFKIPSTPAYPQMGPKKSIVYHTNWANYGRNFQVKDLQPAIAGITDIAYAFFNIKDSGNGNYIIESGDTWADFENPFIGKGVEPQNTWESPPGDLGLLGQFKKLHSATNGAFNLTLSIGGWTWSKNFSLAVRTPQSRRSLVDSIVTLFQKWNLFSGVSLDWEYLSDNGVNYGNEGNVVDRNDARNFVEFLRLLRQLFDQQGWKHYTIAMCCTPAPEKIHFDIKSLVPFLDEWHVMTYESVPRLSQTNYSFAAGTWSKTSAHQSNLYPAPNSPYSASGAVDAYVSRGVPPEKIYIGVPFYSRGFVGTSGLGMPASGPSPDTSWETGVVDYKKLPLEGATEGWDDVAQAGYSYDPNRKVLNTYDTPRAVKAKCDYIKQKGLGGVIIWESSADAPYDSERSLLKVIHDNLLATNNSRRQPPVIPSWSKPRQFGPSTSQMHFETSQVRTTRPTYTDSQLSASSQKSQSSNSDVARWNPSEDYNVNDRVDYQGKIYECLLSHHSQVDWIPDVAVALWKPVSM